MKSTGGSDAAKRRAGEAAADTVEAGMVVGLGTGSTAAYAIEALGDAVDGGLDIVGVPTSFGARQRAIDCGIPLCSLDAIDEIDIAIDGADQFVGDTGSCLKGGGAAHSREKLVASAADTVHIVVDETKLTDALDHPVPLEVLPDAHTVVADAARSLDGEPTLRDAANKDGPVVTDNGNLVCDVDFGTISDPASLATHLSAVPGVVEHGLFVDCATAVSVGRADGVSTTTY
jgi:ribose 5-phosphate isomerase A